jgi:large subunit ribosomal protein L30e
MTIYEGTSLDLGALCGKPFGVSAFVVREPGDSDIMTLVEAQNG